MGLRHDDRLDPAEVTPITEEEAALIREMRDAIDDGYEVEIVISKKKQYRYESN